MGHPSSVSRALRRVREDRKLGRAQRRLSKLLDFKALSKSVTTWVRLYRLLSREESPHEL